MGKLTASRRLLLAGLLGGVAAAAVAVGGARANFLLNPYRFAAVGGTPTQYSTLGFQRLTTTDTLAASRMLLTKVTTPTGSNCTLDRLFLSTASGQVAGVHVKAAIYADNAGTPDVLVATGDEVTLAAGTNEDVDLTFSSTITLAANTTYWIGFFGDGTISYFQASGSETRRVADTYSDGAAASASGAVVTTNTTPALYANVGQTDAVSGVGYISDSGMKDSGASSLTKFRVPLPNHRAPNDIAILAVTYLNVSGAPTWTTPSGWTKIDEQDISDAVNYRVLFYIKRLTGAEKTPIVQESGGSISVIAAVVSLWRGYTTSDPPYEAETTIDGTSTLPAGVNITTLGANRTVVNIYGYETTATFTEQSGSGWTAAYKYTTTTGNDCGQAITYKDQATAASVTKETAALSASKRWRSMTLALIKA